MSRFDARTSVCIHQDQAQATGGFYNSSNIRYAEPPIGGLRLGAPVPVSGTHNGTLNKDDRGVVCPAPSLGWGQIADKFFLTTSMVPFST